MHKRNSHHEAAAPRKHRRMRPLQPHQMRSNSTVAAGGVEEDLIKCMGKTYLGAFNLHGRELRLKGQNRIGNMLVPNNNYCAFEDFMTPLLTEMLQEQEAGGVSWTPSKMIRRLGERIDDESSVYHWCVAVPKTLWLLVWRRTATAACCCCWQWWVCLCWDKLHALVNCSRYQKSLT